VLDPTVLCLPDSDRAPIGLPTDVDNILQSFVPLRGFGDLGQETSPLPERSANQTAALTDETLTYRRSHAHQSMSERSSGTAAGVLVGRNDARCAGSRGCRRHVKTDPCTASEN
jgi:hypothetical protein